MSNQPRPKGWEMAEVPKMCSFWPTVPIYIYIYIYIYYNIIYISLSLALQLQRIHCKQGPSICQNNYMDPFAQWTLFA